MHTLSRLELLLLLMLPAFVLPRGVELSWCLASAPRESCPACCCEAQQESCAAQRECGDAQHESRRLSTLELEPRERRGDCCLSLRVDVFDELVVDLGATSGPCDPTRQETSALLPRAVIGVFDALASRAPPPRSPLCLRPGAAPLRL